MDNNIESKIYNDLVSLKNNSINYSIVCQRIYYHLLEHYGNTLTETYIKSALISDKVEVTLKNLTRTDVIKELTVYNLYSRISSIILENI
jgi:hypothetical protein|tara:strand:- start:561 stop:830 length:270 start_codon:yes stop_codon:yes gene_type:complete